MNWADERYYHILAVVHTFATIYMTGLIWFVQIVHYPLMARVGLSESTDYEREHTRLTGYVVGPPMLIEGISAVLLLAVHPQHAWTWLAWLGVALLAINTISTATLQIPCHNALQREFSTSTHQRLVSSNWIRTTAWTARAVIASIMLN